MDVIVVHLRNAYAFVSFQHANHVLFRLLFAAIVRPRRNEFIAISRLRRHGIRRRRHFLEPAVFHAELRLGVILDGHIGNAEACCRCRSIQADLSDRQVAVFCFIEGFDNWLIQ